jgi:hypothetical protein
VSESGEKNDEKDPVLIILAVLGWLLPIAGLSFGPGQWWQYVVWLVIGTAVIAVYNTSHGYNKESSDSKD